MGLTQCKETLQGPKRPRSKKSKMWTGGISVLGREQAASVGGGGGSGLSTHKGPARRDVNQPKKTGFL